MDVEMSNNSSNCSFVKIEKIAENQQWRSTWKVELDGKLCIAKIIESKDPSKFKLLSESLAKQLRFSKNFNPEDSAGICLFSRKIELEDNQIAFCRQYVDGEALDTLLENKKFAIQEAIELFLKIASIVAKAHNVYKVSHGDLKPANIIMSNDDPVIIDWDTMSMDTSAFQIMNNGKTITIDQITGGTPKYMPPEQCRGEKIDEQCDIYALGIILYQLINKGKTPFDEPPYDAMNSMQLMGAKEQPLDSISGKHPELKVPEDLARIISKAVASDRNRRYMSVNDFIDELSNIDKINTYTHSPIMENIQDEQTPGDFKHKKEDTSISNFVLVGHPQAGKTVLAVGLYATSNKNFTVEAIDSDTKTHAINTKSIIEKSEWPAKTGKGTIKNLNFRIFSKKREAVIRFDEYAGEWMSSVNYFHDVLKQPDGVLLLFNTGAPQLRDPLQRNKMLEDLTNCVTYLCDLDNHPPIAFVVTAADRLETDLKDWTEEFEKHAAKITSSLENRKCKWKRFDVSVCGSLETQEAPKLEPHNTHEPFLWLINELDTRRRFNKLCTMGIVAAIMIALFFTIAGGHWIVEQHAISTLRKNMSEIQSKYVGDKDKNDWLEYSEELVAERLKYCNKGEMHIAKTSNPGSRLEPCNARCATKTFWYKGRKACFDSEIVRLEEAIDKAKVDCLTTLLQDALDAPNDTNCKQVRDIFENWNPLRDISSKENLANRLDKELRPVEQRCNTETLKANLRDIITNKDENLLASIHGRVKQWPNKINALTPDEHTKYQDEIDKLYEDAKTEVYFEKVVKLSQRFSAFKGSYDELAIILADYNSLLAKKPEITKSKVEVKEKHLSEIRNKCLESFVDDKCEDFSRKQMGSKQVLKPEISNELHAKIYPRIDYNCRITLESRIDKKLRGITEQWEAQERKKITDFLEKYRSPRILIDALNEFFKVCQKELDNKYFNEAEQMILSRIYSELRPKISKIVARDVSPRFFSEMQELCAAIQNRCGDSDLIRKDNIYAWVSGYISWRNSNRNFTVEIGDIKAKVNYANPDKPYFRKLQFRESKELDVLQVNYSSRGFITPRFNTEKYKSFEDPCWLPRQTSYSLGNSFRVDAEIWDCRGLDPDELVGKVGKRVFPGLDLIINPYIELEASNYKVAARLDVEISGVPLFSWLKNNPFPKR